MVAVTETNPENLLIVSDLHLSEGWIPERQAYAPKEDFVFDNQFSAFLRHYLTAGRWQNRRWRLVINGDFMDFLQVTDITGAPPDLKGIDDPYGLDCGPRETVWKLQRIFRGHPVCFAALAEFASRWPVVIVKGNHDVEFTFPEVQQEFIRLLVDALPGRQHIHDDGAAATADSAGRLAERIQGNVVFCEWIYVEPGLIYIEHGHQYEANNSFRFFLDPSLPVGYRRKTTADEVELPVGSLIVRYIFNRIETDEPHSDNIKPAELFIKWYIQTHPWKCLGFLFREGRLLVRHTQRMAQLIKHRHYLQRRQSHEARRDALAEKLGLDAADLRWIDGLKKQPTLYRPDRTWNFLLKSFRFQLAYPLLTLWLFCLSTFALGVASLLIAFVAVALSHAFLPGPAFWVPPAWAWKFLVTDVAILLPSALGMAFILKQIKGPDPMIEVLRSVSRSIARRLKVPLVTMGHTHHAETRVFDDGTITYINTGTWTNVFQFGKTRQPEHQMFYLRVLRDCDATPPHHVHQHAELLSWQHPADER